MRARSDPLQPANADAGRERPAERDGDAFDATIAAHTLDEAATQLTAAWDVRGIDIGTMQFKRGTAVGNFDRAPPSTRIATLPSLLAPGPLGTRPQFEMGPVLGEGGMGVVRTAQQIALHREVAVKTLKPDADQREAPQLLREARVTGVLEHPNVVPIYALGRDNEDRPLIVMKRISGESWYAELQGATAEERLSDGYLRKHLAVLKQVALAAHYAHDKGIVHRDLKPDNVMIGDFGEVYVVDWGIAVSLADDVPGVPCVRDITAIEGTPGYMSPEMAAADGTLIDQRSDVYLLGAILHEILTGEPPHGGKTIMDVLTHAFASAPPVYPEAVPRDLVTIAHRAMARFNEDRYPSALAFAEAIDEYMMHRSSTLLSDEAGARLGEARELLAAGVNSERDVEALHAKFSECRFAFTHALRSWPENERALSGLEETLGLMIEHELARDAPRVALSLVMQLPRENPALRARVEAAVVAADEERKRLAALERDEDVSIGAERRRIIGMAIAGVWGFTCVLCGVLTRTETWVVGYNAFAWLCLAIAAGTLLVAFIQRRTVLTTAFNRRLAVFTTMVFIGYAALWLYAGVLGVPKAHATIFHSILGAVVWFSAGLVHNRQWLPIAYGLIATVVLASAVPVYHWEILGVIGGATSMMVTYRSLTQGETRRRRPRERT